MGRIYKRSIGGTLGDGSALYPDCISVNIMWLSHTVVLQDVTIGGKLDKGYRGSFYIICFNCTCTESDLTEAT